jgi:glycosyltransferase involved in cell wall biosynthesis
VYKYIISFLGGIMKKVLYITNIEVPYRVSFFNSFSEKVDLSVLYERSRSSNRNEEWVKSVNPSYKSFFLNGLKISNENSFSMKIFKYLNGNYDTIIFSCVNSPIQILGMLYLRLRGKKYILSLDGEQFVEGRSIKKILKRYIIQGADKYLVAGEIAADNIRKIVNTNEIYPYYFSSYSEKELKHIFHVSAPREKNVLVVGQYYDYKGLDIAVKVARLDRTICYKFIGMGKRTKLFVKEQLTNEDSNIEIIDFLQKDELNDEYSKAGALLLPSRKECWGLVINEAAAFGLPIVSSSGSGAAQEFLRGKYKKFLFDKDDVVGMYKAIKGILFADSSEYSGYLREMSSKYSIENMVDMHLEVIGK